MVTLHYRILWHMGPSFCQCLIFRRCETTSMCLLFWRSWWDSSASKTSGLRCSKPCVGARWGSVWNRLRRPVRRCRKASCRSVLRLLRTQRSPKDSREKYCREGKWSEGIETNLSPVMKGNCLKVSTGIPPRASSRTVLPSVLLRRFGFSTHHWPIEFYDMDVFENSSGHIRTSILRNLGKIWVHTEKGTWIFSRWRSNMTQILPSWKYLFIFGPQWRCSYKCLRYILRSTHRHSEHVCMRSNKLTNTFEVPRGRMFEKAQ